MLKAAHNNNTLKPFLFISGPSCPCCVQASISLKCLKGTVSQDFCFWVFFLESSSPKPLIIHSIRVITIFFKNSICASQGAPPVSMTPAANLPQIRLKVLTSGANCHQYLWHRRQIMRKISDCWHHRGLRRLARCTEQAYTVYTQEDGSFGFTWGCPGREKNKNAVFHPTA